MYKPSRSPSELRNMFGANLRILSKRYPSISELSRKLGINRTQFNRYLSGESFPRPDVLDRICSFFDVDARILLEPVEQLSGESQIFSTPYLSEFMGKSAVSVSEDVFPSGFYRFSRRSFTDSARFVIGLCRVHRENALCFVRGFEAAEAMRQQGLSTAHSAREFRGFILRQEDGVALLISRRNAMTGSFNYLSRVASFENNFWLGYVTRTMRETVTGTRVTRLVYEHLGTNTHAILAAARGTGLCTEEQLLPFHRRLLQVDAPFR